MSAASEYEVDGYRFRFTRDESPYTGLLICEAPERERFSAEINLTKPRSRSAYAKEAAEFWGVEQPELKAALSRLASIVTDEVQAAQDAEEELLNSLEQALEVPQHRIYALIGAPGVLGRCVEAAAEYSRVVGERAVLKLLALNALSAQLGPLPNGRPLGANVMLTGGAGRGKNYLCDAVARLLPEGFYLPFQSSSAKALYYMAEDNPTFLKHHWAYPNEAEAADMLVELFRPLLSSARSKHLTVNKDSSGHNAGQELLLEGPVTITIPTIRNKMDNQLQSRMLTAGLDDYEGRVAAHSAAVSEQLSPDLPGTDYSMEIAEWQAALRSLTGLRRVVTPAEHPEFRLDSDQISNGARLWTNILALMCTHAWLEQNNRAMRQFANGEQAIVAAPEDYEVAYEIFNATCERSIVNFSDTHRKILNALSYLRVGRNPWLVYSQRKTAQESGVSQSAISENKTYLVKSAKVLEESMGGLRLVEGADPSWWETGEVPTGIPAPENVRRWWTQSGHHPDSDDLAE